MQNKFISTIIPYQDHLIQTAVAVILNKNSFLLIKRKLNPKDPHSGQLAFPGGKVEKNENTIQTAIRETYEEIGVTLTEGHHLGHSHNNYLAYYNKNKAVMMAAHIFKIDDNLSYKISEQEVDRVIELSLDDICMNNMMCKRMRAPSAHVFARSEHRQQYLLKNVMKGFKYLYVPYLSVEKHEIFYGLSWLILCNILCQQSLKQDVIDFTFNSYQFAFEQERKSEFFTEWYKRARLNQFVYVDQQKSEQI